MAKMMRSLVLLPLAMLLVGTVANAESVEILGIPNTPTEAQALVGEFVESSSICGDVTYSGSLTGNVHVLALDGLGAEVQETVGEGPGPYCILDVPPSVDLPLDEPANDVPLPPGRGFWIVNNQTNEQTVTMAGEVPANAAMDIAIHPGINYLAYPYPIDIAWEDTSLAINSPSGSRIILWDADTSSFSVHAKISGGWVPGGASLAIGQGLIYFQPDDTVTNWHETIPYDLSLGTGLPDTLESAMKGTADGSVFFFRASASAVRSAADLREAGDAPAIAQLPIDGVQPSNLVGLRRFTIPAGGRVLVSSVFWEIGPRTHTVGSAMGSQLTGGETMEDSDQLGLFDGASKEMSWLWKPGSGPWQTGAVQSGGYLVAAFLDENGNGEQDDHEPSGIYPDLPLHVMGNVSGIDIQLVETQNYWLDTEVSGSGTVDVPDGWYAAGSAVVVTASHAPNWHFSRWEGDTNGCDLAGNVITANMTQARSVTAVFEIDQKTLTVVSARGGADPGTETVDYGSFVEQSVTNSPVSGGAGTRYVCTAADVAGNAFTQVSPTSVTLTLTNDATLTWQWATEYWLDVSSGTGGSVNVTSQWLRAGVVIELTATPSNGYDFVTWTGDVSLAQSTTNPLSLTMDSPKTVAAGFVLTDLDSDHDGLTDAWELRYFGSPTAADPNGDPDGDQLVNLDEADLGTDPTDPDTDDDTFDDWWEAVRVSDPLDPNDIPAASDHDFETDGASDVGVYHAQRGNWYIRRSTNGVLLTGAPINWGVRTTTPVPADYDGDGAVNIGVFWPPGARWYIRRPDGQLLDGSYTVLGTPNAIPVPADYDGDKIADLATFNPSDGRWTILQSTDKKLYRGGSFVWGPTAVPVPGDYDGDGLTDCAVYARSDGLWYILLGATGKPMPGGPRQWGGGNVWPVPGDYDRDGITDLAIYDLSNALWYIRQSSDGKTMGGGPIRWGSPGDMPVPGDYDRDARTDLAIYALVDGSWHIRSSITGQKFTGQGIAWGRSFTIPTIVSYQAMRYFGVAP